MRYLIPLSILSLAFTYAAVASPTYIVNGRQANAEAAILAAIRGATVMQCKEMELKPSKSGTSIALRARKQGK